MSKIEQALKNKKSFVGFLTAGDPSIEKSAEFIISMAKAGASLIEIGIPFSDPVAEGPVIQAANLRALEHNVSVDDVFSLVQTVRQEVEIPLVFLTYLNPVFNYGYEAFFKKCQSVGIDGIIIPDVPFEEKAEISLPAKKYQVDIISLIAPTSEQRIEMIAAEAEGFLYVVSSMGVTGVREDLDPTTAAVIEKVKTVATIPCLVGFGISTPEQASVLSQASDGVIVGSAIVKIIEDYGDAAAKPLFDYVKSMVAACQGK